MNDAKGSAAQLTEAEIESIFRQLGTPSWSILAVLHPVDGKPGIAIIREVEQLLMQADSPTKRLDPSTLHRAIARMEKLGLVKRLKNQLVDVPVGHATVKTEWRPVWVLTANGEVVRRRWQHTIAVLSRPHAAPSGSSA